MWPAVGGEEYAMQKIKKVLKRLEATLKQNWVCHSEELWLGGYICY